MESQSTSESSGIIAILLDSAFVVDVENLYNI